MTLSTLFCHAVRGNHQHIVVIAVVVDNTLPQPVQFWLGVRQITMSGIRGSWSGFLIAANHLNKTFDDLGCLFEIPVKFPVCRRMLKAAEGLIQAPR